MGEPSYTMDQAAQQLNIGRNTLFAILREQKILDAGNVPFREYREKGYLASRQSPITIRSTGITKFVSKTVVTNKGMKWLGKVLNKHDQQKSAAAAKRKRATDKAYYQKKKAQRQLTKLVLSTPWIKNNEPDYCKI